MIGTRTKAAPFCWVRQCENVQGRSKTLQFRHRQTAVDEARASRRGRSLGDAFSARSVRCRLCPQCCCVGPFLGALGVKSGLLFAVISLSSIFTHCQLRAKRCPIIGSATVVMGGFACGPAPRIADKSIERDQGLDKPPSTLPQPRSRCRIA